MPTLRCFVVSCENRVAFRFPKDTEMRSKWLAAIGRIDDHDRLKPDDGICRDHFSTDDFLTIGRGSGAALIRRRLKREAVPCVYILPDQIPSVQITPNRSRCHDLETTVNSPNDDTSEDGTTRNLLKSEIDSET